ncbi:hypothetical protein U9U05_002376 [Salmonella enterica]|nr:hypothetical protein [Salmonella enterica]
MKILSRSRNLLLLLAGILSLLSFSARAYNAWSYCDSTGSTQLQFHNITFKSGSLPGPGSILYTSEPYTIGYSCTTLSPPVGGGPALKYAPLFIRLGDIQPLVQALKDAGLGMNLILQESGQPPVTWYWNEINTSNFANKVFGASVPAGASDVRRTMTIRLQLVIADTINRAQIVHVPSLTSFAVSIVTSGWLRAVQITTSAFDIRYIPDNYGTVTVMPSSFALGHIYTTMPEPRRVSFSVTAAQRAGTSGPLGSFTIPLNITFTANNKALTDAGQAILLNNDDGQQNGLKLSIKDNDTAGNITFGQASTLGTLVVAGSGLPPPPVTKQYTARVEPVAGQTLKTGSFSADVVATVTYN